MSLKRRYAGCVNKRIITIERFQWFGNEKNIISV